MKWTNSLKETSYKAQEEISNLKNSTSIKEMEFVVKEYKTGIYLETNLMKALYTENYKILLKFKRSY